MGYLIGTDEAGYGPNLGPLVVSATVWETPDDVGVEDLFDRVGHVIAPRLNERLGDGGATRVVMADSKTLYSPKLGLRHLERGLWAAFGLLLAPSQSMNYSAAKTQANSVETAAGASAASGSTGRCPRTWRDVWKTLAPEALDAMSPVPWYAGYDAAAPSEHDVGEVDAASLQAALAASGVRLSAVRSRAVFTHEFNDMVERHDSKGTALSHETLALAARMIDALPPGPISVVCDKHGGRNRYADFLADHFPDAFIEIHGEGRDRSTYRFGPPARRIEFCFRTKAELCLPAALASMASKYLRESAMRAFNEFWRGHVPNLRPTAGYPEDAKRFRVDIAEAQRRLDIPDRMLWRTK